MGRAALSRIQAMARRDENKNDMGSELRVRQSLLVPVQVAGRLGDGLPDPLQGVLVGSSHKSGTVPPEPCR